MYQMQRRRKDEYTLTDEECDVAEALKAYSIDPEQPTHFVSVPQLYRLYLAYVAGLRMQDPGTILGRRAFGAALRRVFPLDEEGPDPYYVQRTVNGVRSRGYLGLVGPLSAPSNDWPGRPPHNPE